MQHGRCSKQDITKSGHSADRGGEESSKFRTHDRIRDGTPANEATAAVETRLQGIECATVTFPVRPHQEQHPVANEVADVNS